MAAAPLQIKDLDELIELLEAESKKRKKSECYAKYSLIAVFGIYLATMALVWILKHKFPSDLTNSMGSFAGLGGAGAAISSRHRQALQLAKQFDDPRLLPYLIEVTSVQQSKVPELAREILVEKLPIITSPADLPVAARQKLASSLNATTNVKYIRAALDALQVCGEAEAIPSLESFLNRKPIKNKREIERLKDRAHLALGDVRMRAARNVIVAKEAETSQILGQLAAAPSAIPASSNPVPLVSEQA